MTDRAVDMKGVAKRLGAIEVLRSFSLAVPRGGTLGILGPSGCGKTTVLRLIAGLEVPDDGEIWLGGELASSAGRLAIAPARRNIGFVFQDLALWPHMSVARNLGFMLESRAWPSSERRARIDELLALVGLRDRADEYPSHLSGGEQQRVALARALVANPALLLLDEPLSSLDADLREGLRTELAAIPKRLGVTMIYVTHDRADVDAFGGEIIVMNRPSAQAMQMKRG